MNTKFKQLRALLTQKEWDNFLANQYMPESFFDRETLDGIISGSFVWDKSPQGHDYWSAIRERVRDNLPVPDTLQTVPEELPVQLRIDILEELVVACQQWADNTTTGNEHRIKEVLANLESKTENTNDFSKCKIGDKLWSIQLGNCVVSAIYQSGQPYPIKVANENGVIKGYTFKGLYEINDYHQSLFFSNPNIIAPPEPVRFPDYKPGQWIAVWNNASPVISKYCGFSDSGKCETWESNVYIQLWDNHCTIEELPEVLAKWGEQK